ncbi:MAG: DHH family phosphoesterase [Candidatus Hadarchaeum sp.]|uniref:DHH family phosphoesterase n=1 Tax=Candidatus Hadarchaeum sp. TaxID=2883567 RepID=UPI003D127540
MTYREQLKFLLERDAGFSEAVGLLKQLGQRSGLEVGIFSHHDVDGVSSALILHRMFRRLGAKVVIKFPERFKLLEEDLKLIKGKFDLLVISDKGTFASYDDFFEKAENVLIIDHHAPDGNPKKASVFNPAMESHTLAATSLLCHMLATQFGPTDELDDLTALLGCRADFAFDPVEERCGEFVRPFIERSMKKFPHLFKTRLGRPTMYDVVDRRRTALTNQMAEALHVGTLAHYYGEFLNSGVSGPELVFDFLKELPADDLIMIKNLDDFLSMAPAGKTISRILESFQLDWELLEIRVRSPIFLGEIKSVGVYLVFAREVPRMQSTPFAAVLPYVASTQLEPLRRAFGHEATMIMVFCPKENGVQISMRGGGGRIDCSLICAQLVDRLRRLYPGCAGIEGGVHPDAAECFSGKSVPIYAVMRELLLMIKEWSQQEIRADGGGHFAFRVMG